MRIRAFFLIFFVSLASSSPARRRCGIQNCYTAVNECSMTYGGCWDECENGPREMPTFTAPLCNPNIAATQSGTGYSAPGAMSSMSASTSGPTDSSITPPPTSNVATVSEPGPTTACSPTWLCVDYIATCGNETQMYGGCYDICMPAPPVSSPSCSLSSSTSEPGYGAPTLSPEPGAAYTKEPASDNSSSAIDDSKALVMAEMPSSDAPASQPSLAVEFRLANVDAPSSSPAEAQPLIEAPANLRGAAIAKLMADKVRQPITDNVPCWDKDTCKEVQLGIPSPAPVDISAVSSTTYTAEASAATSADPVAVNPSSSPAEVSTEAPAEGPTDAPTEDPAPSMV
ncbi:hypothetical protein OPT61_g3042 [Boeremia exigua]|uniref:Uncharacterized protein n=1 Tax=Boeremia exigua TaxID=749465 RepID=A0ACC2IJH1_9PLEO|nr:hypothetical protein OPT61_g3042 [Boeremia exigua]